MDRIYGNEFYDLIVRNRTYLPPTDEEICVLDVGRGYSVFFVPREGFPPLGVANYNYNVIPACYQPLTLEDLDISGILQVRQTPGLALDGKGVLLGFLDSGIDTTHPAFHREGGESRIVAVWDQNYREMAGESQMSPGTGLPRTYYGTVYGREDLYLYGNGDETGHGTYVASVAAGSDVGQFTGAAPGADIAMVHLKQAKDNLKAYYFIPENAVCYGENDLLFGIQFLDELAQMRNQPLVICMSLGCGLSGHSGNNPLALYLDDLAVAYRRCVVTAAGNEAASRRHYQGSLAEPYQEVEIVVEENVCGFVMEQWSVAPARFEVSVASPTGQVQPLIGILSLQNQNYEFPLDGTKVEISYSYPEATTGNQLIYYRFTTPSPGIWRVRVYGLEETEGIFHMYLPGEELTCSGVYFLSSNPDTTIMNPGNARRVLTAAGYNGSQDAILLESGRGYTLEGQQKPDLAAPGYGVAGAVAGRGIFPVDAQYEGRTGTSAAAAICSGAAAMYMEWCQRRRDERVNTTQVKNFLIRGARQKPEELYPNRQWGYGALDLYESFRRL